MNEGDLWQALRLTIRVLAHLIEYGAEWDDEERMARLSEAFALLGGDPSALTEGGWQPDAHSDADIPIQTEHCTHSHTPTSRNTVGSCR